MSINTWLSDKLHVVLGLSDRSITEYLTRLATEAASQGSVCEQLEQSGIHVDSDMRGLVKELYERIHGTSSSGEKAQSSSIPSRPKRPAPASDSDSEGEGPLLLGKKAKEEFVPQDEESSRLRDLSERYEGILELTREFWS
ncbi:hypothetical protein FHG87_025498 [Trinorchestia longiramus]|nr:hypothetical protein FHG87_025498 [Trinorchestia longiramus]